MTQLIFKIKLDNEIVSMFKKRMTAILNSNAYKSDRGVYFEIIEDGTIYQIYKNKEIFDEETQYAYDNIEKFLESKPDSDLSELLPSLYPILRASPIEVSLSRPARELNAWLPPKKK